MIIGIDPGAKGGIAFLEGDNYLVYPMSNLLDTAGIIRSKRSSYAIDWAFIEKVHAFPGQGVVSMFSFGQRFGEILGILAALNVPVVEVPPQAWQARILGPNVSDTKKASIAFCYKTWPRIELHVGKKEHDGMADALCIAYYGWLRSNPKP